MDMGAPAEFAGVIAEFDDADALPYFSANSISAPFFLASSIGKNLGDFGDRFGDLLIHLALDLLKFFRA
jgi:hypothetical protein